MQLINAKGKKISSVWLYLPKTSILNVICWKRKQKRPINVVGMKTVFISSFVMQPSFGEARDSEAFVACVNIPQEWESSRCFGSVLSSSANTGDTNTTITRSIYQSLNKIRYRNIYHILKECGGYNININRVSSACEVWSITRKMALMYPDNKIHGANIGPIWGRQSMYSLYGFIPKHTE